MIRAFKYRGKTQAARPFGRLLFFLYCRHYTKGLRKGSPPDVIIPVPLHIRRFRQRGFNQAWLLVKEWPEYFRRLNQENHPQLIKDGLVRHRFTKPQAGLDKKNRKTNIKGAFGLSKKLDVTGKHILLVDDVYTTGATAEECAAVLLKNGARTIDILTLSRTC
jgi:ComF family protein